MFAGKRYSKVITAVVLALAITFTSGMFSVPAQAETSISELQIKQAELEKQQAAVAAKLKSLKADKTQKLAYQDMLVTQIKNVQSQIDVLNAQVSALNADIKTKSAEISTKQALIGQNFEKLKQRVRALYLMGEASDLEIILNAKSVTDFADKVQMLHAITTHDSQLINALKTELKSIQTQQAAIEVNRTKVAAAKTELDTKNSELNGLAAETQAAVSQISASETVTSAQKEKLAAEERAQEAAVDQWYQNYYANLKAQQAKRKAQNASSKASSAVSSSSNNTASNNTTNKSSSSSNSGSGAYTTTGNFCWPTPSLSVITTQFWELDDRGIPHKGIDIAGHSCYGAQIVAIDSGTVMFSAFGTSENYHYGYGNVVQIDHGGGYSSLYAHCSKLCVSEGQQVTKGQTIAYVGDTGRAFGAHLHFEIRLNGVPQNPRQWFHYS
ncbi:MAG TPA: peptidoglycan DD-metalloendopeptidase family protein [Oscillospiraceae bacterium]|nr:peptidoglycan DD-metalloendopeptidase family protein [Oscillospiraceae bacterium]